MRAMPLGGDSSKASKPASAFLQCDLKVVSNLLKSNFVKINSNLTLNSTFKTPNIKSYDLLKEDFYVSCPAPGRLEWWWSRTFFLLLKRALNVEEMFDENKYVCLLNDVYIGDDPAGDSSANRIMDLLKLIKEKSIPVKTGIEFGNELVEINATLLENLVGCPGFYKRPPQACSNPCALSVGE